MVHRAASEVGSAVLTAVSTTVVGFLPVFTMTGPEGKLFRPLAFTKTFALIASIIIALTVIPPLAHAVFCWRFPPDGRGWGVRTACGGGGGPGGGGVVARIGFAGRLGRRRRCVYRLRLAAARVPERLRAIAPIVANAAVVLLVGVLLAGDWEPLGPQRGAVRNFLFVAMLVGGFMALFGLFQHFYGNILAGA